MKSHLYNYGAIYTLGIIATVTAITSPDFTIEFSGGFAWFILLGLMYCAGRAIGAFFEILSKFSIKLWNKRQK